MRYRTRLLIVSITLVLSFSYGIGVGLYRWFPFDYLFSIKRVLSGSESSVMNDLVQLSVNHAKNRSFTSFSQHRKMLKAHIIDEGLAVKIKREAIEPHSDKITVRIYGVTVNGILTKAARSNDCLRIYIQGHGGNPFDFKYHNKLLRHFNSEGCDVLSLSMLGLGLNQGDVSFPSHFGIIKLNAVMAENHGNYALFFDRNHPQLDPMALFIAPHYYLINYLINDYEDVAILGISGGGWYTVWLAALMPEIDRSISYAGSLPFEYRKFACNHGDWEQIYSNIYSYTSYWWLYRLMTVNDNNEIVRHAVLVYNNKDDCCFMDPYASHFKKQIESLGWQNILVMIDKSRVHTMNVDLVNHILAKAE